MKKYKHLSLEEREKYFLWKNREYDYGRLVKGWEDHTAPLSGSLKKILSMGYRYVPLISDTVISLKVALNRVPGVVCGNDIYQGID